MPGTKIGARKAVATNLKRNPNFYKEIGAIGGSKGHTGGFAYDDRTIVQKLLRKPKRAVIQGRKGGSISKRRKKTYGTTIYQTQ